MSKSNRRRQRPGSQSSTARPSGQATPNPAGPGTPPLASTGAGTPRTPGTTGAPRPTGTRPTSTATRHGRRERSRATYQPSFMERYRTAIVVVAALAGVALISAFVFLSASQPAYACSTVWTPAPTPSPTAGATPNLGYVQPDMGRDHVSRGDKVTYTYCAPASGSHGFASGIGPITVRVYGPGDNVIPQGWIHNLEHGGMVILYQGTSPGATPEGQAQMKAFFEAFPPVALCGPVIARFDQMSSPFQAILWGRVLPLETFDEAQIMAYWNQWGGRSNPEKACPPPNAGASPAPSASAAPSGSAVPSASAVPSPSPDPSVAAPAPSASPAPSVAAPAPSATPAPSVAAPSPS